MSITDHLPDKTTPKIGRQLCLPLLAILISLSVAYGGDAIYGQPEDPLVARVFATEIHSRDPQEVQFIILQRLLERYTEDHQIVVTDEEIDAYRAAQERFMERDRQRRAARRTELAAQLQAGALGAEEQARLTRELEILDSLATSDRDAATEESAEVRAYADQVARSFIRRWKVNRALYQQYGGRVIFQQAGPEPLDAYRTFLEEQQALGHFAIVDPGVTEKFWYYFVTDTLHDFYPPGSEEEARAFDRMFLDTSATGNSAATR